MAAGVSIIAAAPGATAITIVDLQPDRAVVRAEIRRAPDEAGTASLTNLSPHINSWFLLTLDWPVSGEHESFHLENPDPKNALTSVAADDPTWTCHGGPSDGKQCNAQKGSADCGAGGACAGPTNPGSLCGIEKRAQIRKLGH